MNASGRRTQRTTSPNPKTQPLQKTLLPQINPHVGPTTNKIKTINPDIESVPKEDYDKDISPESTQWKQITKKWVQSYEKIEKNKYSPKLVNKLDTKQEPVISLPNLNPANVESIRVGPGMGKYAKRMFKTNKSFNHGEPICELKGHLMLLYDETKLSDYVMSRPYSYVFFLQTGIGSICIDARYKSNEARYMRKCCQPNAEIQNCMSGKNMHFFVVANRDINEDEEITVQYDFKWREATYDVECSCATKRSCDVAKYNRERKKKAIEKEQERKQAEKEQRAEIESVVVDEGKHVNLEAKNLHFAVRASSRVKSVTEKDDGPGSGASTPTGRKSRTLIKTEEVKGRERETVKVLETNTKQVDKTGRKEKEVKKGSDKDTVKKDAVKKILDKIVEKTDKDPEFTIKPKPKPTPVIKQKGGRGRKKKNKKEEEEKIDFLSFGLHKQFDEFKELVENWRVENPLQTVEIPKGDSEDCEVMTPYKLKPYEPVVNKIESIVPENFDFDKFFRPHNDLVTSAPHKLPELIYTKSKEVKSQRKLPKKCWKDRLEKEYTDKETGEVLWPDSNPSVQTSIQVMSYEDYERINNPKIVKIEEKVPVGTEKLITSIGLNSSGIGILKKSSSEQVGMNSKNVVDSVKPETVFVKSEVKKQKISYLDYLNQKKT